VGRNRPRLLATRSPAQSLIPGSIILYKDTWETHILWSHDVEFFHVQDTLADPDYICASKTEEGDWVFVSEGHTDEHGRPNRVAVRNVDGQNIVTSAYYADATWHGVVLWRRGDD
jgi:hypothetical protein